MRMNDEGPDPNTPQNPPPAVDVRVCDYYANKLAGAEIFPDCELDWPKEKRDSAIATDKALLKQYGAAFQFHSPGITRFAANRVHNSTQPWFEKLDHPATAQDVEQGRAIFSLGGGARLWPMPAYPLYADRPASPQDPTKWSDGTNYTTDGYVWQAEEVLVDGKWERYYGFTGRHQITKVPASEINFPGGAPWTWVPVTPFFDGTIELVENKQLRVAGYNSYAAAADMPLAVMIKAHNHNGLDQQVPASLTIPVDTAKTLPPGIALHLTYSEKIDPAIANPPAQTEPFGFFSAPRKQFDYGAWSDVPAKKEISVAGGKTAGPFVPAGGDLTLLQIDLRDYFHMSRPGTYRLQVEFEKSGNPSSPPEYRPPNGMTFTVLDKTK